MQHFRQEFEKRRDRITFGKDDNTPLDVLKEVSKAALFSKQREQEKRADRKSLPTDHLPIPTIVIDELVKESGTIDKPVERSSRDTSAEMPKRSELVRLLLKQTDQAIAQHKEKDTFSQSITSFRDKAAILLKDEQNGNTIEHALENRSVILSPRDQLYNTYQEGRTISFQWEKHLSAFQQVREKLYSSIETQMEAKNSGLKDVDAREIIQKVVSYRDHMQNDLKNFLTEIHKLQAAAGDEYSPFYKNEGVVHYRVINSKHLQEMSEQAKTNNCAIACVIRTSQRYGLAYDTSATEQALRYTPEKGSQPTVESEDELRRFGFEASLKDISLSDVEKILKDNKTIVARLNMREGIQEATSDFVDEHAVCFEGIQKIGASQKIVMWDPHFPDKTRLIPLENLQQNFLKSAIVSVPTRSDK